MSLALIAHLAEHALEDPIVHTCDEVAKRCGDLTKNEKTALVTAVVMRSFRSIIPLWDMVHKEVMSGGTVFAVGPQGGRYDAPANMRELPRWFARQFTDGRRFVIERDGKINVLPHVEPERACLGAAREPARSLS